MLFTIFTILFSTVVAAIAFGIISDKNSDTDDRKEFALNDEYLKKKVPIFPVKYMLSFAFFSAFLVVSCQPREAKEASLKFRVCDRAVQLARGEFTGALWREYSGISHCSFEDDLQLSLNGITEGTLRARVSLKDDSPFRFRSGVPTYPFEANFRVTNGNAQGGTYEIILANE